jgi:hypothetical protein
VVFLGGLMVTVASILAIDLPATRAERASEEGPRMTATVSDVQQHRHEFIDDGLSACAANCSGHGVRDMQAAEPVTCLFASRMTASARREPFFA